MGEEGENVIKTIFHLLESKLPIIFLGRYLVYPLFPDFVTK